MKKSLLYVLSLVVVASMVLTACGGAPAATEPPAAEPQFTCALITPNPLGDRSFIDASARGIEQANAELPVNCDIIETNGVAEHETALRGAIANNYDLVLGLAMDTEMFVSLAEEFPDQKFASPSEIFLDALPPNMVAYQIDVHESSFLVGLIVGSLTQTKTVGAVVGGDAPGLNQFYYGYKQGVLEVCPDCEVLVSYLGFDFSNPTLGLETALGLYDQGADIIYQVAGRSGEGVLEAAAQRDLYAIGVDSNQDDIQPGHVIVSSLKKVESTTFDPIKLVVDGTFTGGFQKRGLKEGFAGLSWDEGSTTFEDQGPAELTALIPEIKTLVEEYRAKILSGEYKVCDAFVADSPECVALLAQ
ncbi:MAG TPA: BMP family ABC transporter substrate-binding protein [Anaerolineales bacterium]|nr:BMP family ABC transporter substrate-binding protein [Anaerolineales bacterium]